MTAMQVAALLLTMSMPQQEEVVSQENAGYEPLAADSLVLRYYRPQRVDSDDLIQVATELYGHQLLVRTETPGQSPSDAWVPHFLELEESILVRDTPRQAELIVASLREIEQNVAPEEPAQPSSRRGGLESFHYRPRNLSVQAALEALRPYQGTLSKPPVGGAGQWIQVEAITGSPNTGTVFVRETAERLAEIRAYLEQIDVPIPQATFHYLILVGSDEGASDPALPQELASNLARLVPANHFEIVSSGLVRGSVSQPIDVADQSGISSYELELKPASFDAATRQLNVERCSFVFERREAQDQGRRSSRQSFRTAATLRDGEYTALGAVGPDPVFVVLRMELDRVN